MKLPVSWLREYVDVPAPLEEIADRLAVATAEVDRIIRRGIPDTDGNLGLYKIGRVLEAGKHPNADRLQLCQVDVGEGDPRQIVCGAWNFGPGRPSRSPCRARFCRTAARSRRQSSVAPSRTG